MTLHNVKRYYFVIRWQMFIIWRTTINVMCYNSWQRFWAVHTLYTMYMDTVAVYAVKCLMTSRNVLKYVLKI